MAKGLYSIIQYCPCRFRAESVNVGLVLFCPEYGAFESRIVDNFDRLLALFPTKKTELQTIKQSIESFQIRTDKRISEFDTDEAIAQKRFEEYAASHGNDIQMTSPRMATINYFRTDFERLFNKLC